MVKTKKNDYFMEHLMEAERLSRKVNSEKFVNDYLAKHLNNAKNVLEVACGPGVILSSAATLYPAVFFSGIDVSEDRINHAIKHSYHTPNTFPLRGDALYLPFQSNCFDFVFTRFLLQYLPNPEDAVSEMIRVCKPGGKIFLQDLDGQLQWYFPEDAQIKEKIERVIGYLHKNTGFDPFIGRKLFNLLQTHGLINIQAMAESYNLSWGKMGNQFYKLWETKLDIAIPVMTQALGNEKEAHSLKKSCLDYFLREDTLIYSVAFTVSGEKPLAIK